jgi:hypothetical protein
MPNQFKPNQFKFVRQEDIRKPDHLVICASCSETLDAWLLELPFKPIEGELGMRTASNQPDSVGSELE